VSFLLVNPFPPTHDRSLNSEADEFHCNQLFIGASIPPPLWMAFPIREVKVQPAWERGIREVNYRQVRLLMQNSSFRSYAYSTV
jgi:hypothetical protein